MEVDAAWVHATSGLYIRGQKSRAWREALRAPDVVREFRAAYEDAPRRWRRWLACRPRRSWPPPATGLELELEA